MNYPIEGWKIALFLAIAALLIGTTLYLANTTDMVRDSGSLSEEGQRKNPKKTFSLARIQMALWTVNILLGFIFLAIFLQTLNLTFPTTLLGLMGISVGATLGSSVVDSNSQSSGNQPYADSSSGSWLKDILSSGGTVNVHRYQMLLWTMVITAIFWVKVLYQLQHPAPIGTPTPLPDFDSTLLALAGISNGAYLGLKVLE